MSRSGYSVKITSLFIIILLSFNLHFVDAQEVLINQTKPGPTPEPDPEPLPPNYEKLYQELLKKYYLLSMESEAITFDNPIIYYDFEDDILPYNPRRIEFLEKLHNPAYGEDNQLDQLVDNFENENYIAILDDVIRNSSLNCIELNSSAEATRIYDSPQLREHDFYAGQTPGIVFSIGGNDYVQMTSANAPLGHGWIFFHVDPDWMDGLYLRWNWTVYYSGGAPTAIGRMWAFDAEWDRTDDNDFPEGARIGEQLELYIIPAHVGWSGWTVVDYQFNNVSGASSPNITIGFWVGDAWNTQNVALRLDWVEFNEGAGGTSNLVTINFEDSTNVVMEQTGTQDDYGYVNNTGLPFTEGGYESDGYFLTEDYLNYSDGESLVLMTNATIPGNTNLTVQFSPDNSSWVNNQGVSGYNSITAGFQSLDLRDLNYTDIFFMYNFTSANLTGTPRIFQSRLVSTGSASVSEENYSIIFLGLMIGLLFGLAISLNRG